MKKENKYLVLDEDNNTEYIITKKDKGTSIKYVMKRSKGEQWNEDVKGEKLFTLVDNDDDITIKSHDSTMKNMQYHNCIELMVLLNFVNEQSHMPSNYKIVKV